MKLNNDVVMMKLNNDVVNMIVHDIMVQRQHHSTYHT